LPLLRQNKLKKDERRLRIVSAGCSSGEEVYTLAMLLLESGIFLWDWDVCITGIDIDSRILARARDGVYPPRAFQATPPHLMTRYFTQCAEGARIKDVLRTSTRFVEGNLLELDSIVDEQDVDIIFCRNVLIYFNDETIRRIALSFHRALAPEGHLFLGHSESLSRITNRYLPMRFPGAIIYRKRD
ncbi:MAG TPA: protein-glutamate O-methyltransferase CheR, partial [Geobacteraceae bacterium]